MLYDCFLFYNEFDLLKIRLEETWDLVDYFVLCEGAYTFSGLEKPLHFNENRSKFEKYMDKIIYVPVHQKLEKPRYYDRRLFKPFRKWPKSLAWHQERLQREMLKNAITDRCSDDDVVMLSDVDEIIRRKDLARILSHLDKHKDDFVVCSTPLYRFYLNMLDADEGEWFACYLSRWANIKSHDFDMLRRRSRSASRTALKGRQNVDFHNVGWHFTTLGAYEAMIDKYESASHQEFNNAAYKNYDYYSKVLSGLTQVEIDETFPEYVRSNLEYFKQQGFIFTDHK